MVNVFRSTLNTSLYGEAVWAFFRILRDPGVVHAFKTKEKENAGPHENRE